MPGVAGRSGDRPEPTALKILKGNPGRRPLPVDEPHPTIRLPSPPKELSPEAKREWRRTGRQLRDLGIMSEIDRAAFAAFCTTYTQWLAVQALLAQSPVIVRTQEGEIRANPLLRVAKDLQEQWTRALLEFGMSPSSRTRIRAAAPVRQQDALEEFLNAKRA